MAKVLAMLEKLGLVASAPDPNAAIASFDLDAEPAPAASAPEPVPVAPPAKPHQPEHRSIPAVSFSAEAAAAVDGAGANPEDFPLDKIYASAGITPPAHGFTVDKLVEMMNAEEFVALEPATKATVIAGLLRRLPGGAVDVDDIVADAARRDQALDAFESFLADRVRRAAAEVEASNAALQQEIDELARTNGELMTANRQRLTEEQARFDRWLTRKRGEEQRLFDAVRPFVGSNPVTLDRGEA